MTSRRPIRPSHNASRRAVVLLLVHVAIALHVTHFIVAGRTLSPVEPSEAMYTLELGQVNAGFVFLLVALLATLVFGRFFCGWGCHVVALQDLCGWLMKKLGVRPRPFRSRWLPWAPLVLALYMFAWPSLRRLLPGAESTFPGFSNHLSTSGFWDTFPGPVFAVLTFLTCGFAAVYLLGAKGFCTYACPYGGLFGVVDRLAPGRITVNDDCEQCGHCTATCTSNVLVHQEVKDHGRVVDPGCMKCMDCVSVCPKNALSFSFGTPAILERSPSTARKTYSLGAGEELIAAVLFLAGTLSFRSLYDGPPLLMSACLGALTAFLAVRTWHLRARPTVRLQSLALKAGGRISTSGWVFAAFTVAWLVFTAHSGFVQWHRWQGRRHLERTEVSRQDALTGAFLGRAQSSEHERAASRARRHFGIADGWGLVDVVEIKLGLAWTSLLDDDVDGALDRAREALALAPDEARQHENLIEILLARGRFPEAVNALRAKIDAVEPTVHDHFRLATLLAQAGLLDEALVHQEAGVELTPGSAEARYNLGAMLRRVGRTPEAVEALREASRLAPEDPDTRVELGLALATAGATEAAIAELERAIELAPKRPESRLHLPGLIEELRASQPDGQ